MSEINQRLQRYQNPELFERLAMEYAIGIMHGGARRRFETLMERHLYLRATTEAYEHKFARLAELLPEEQPSPRVWKKIEKQTHQQANQQKGTVSAPWWQSLQAKMMGLAASIIFAVSALFVLLPTTTVSADGYVAVLESPEKVPMAMATAKEGDGIQVKLMDDMDVPSNMELKLWCLPKKAGEKPMMMGVLAKSGQSKIKINKKIWQGLADVSALAISLEPVTAKNTDGPEGKVLYQGALKVMSENG